MAGKNETPTLVVRAHAPMRRLWVIGALAVLVCVGLYLVYELGRYDAGYDRQAAAQSRVELRVQVEHLEKENHELRTRLAALDTVRIGQAREQTEIARTIGELQAQVARQSQEIAFYQKVLPEGTPELGVRVSELRISAAAQPDVYALHFTLLRTGRPDKAVTGTIGVTVEAGGGTHLDLAALTGGAHPDLPFNFRYYQNFDTELRVPAGVKPEHLTVQVRGGRSDAAPLEQSFLWSVER